MLGAHEAGRVPVVSTDHDIYKLFSLPRVADWKATDGNQLFYSFDYGQLHCVCLNGWLGNPELPSDDPVNTAFERQLAWLKADLERAQ